MPEGSVYQLQEDDNGGSKDKKAPYKENRNYSITNYFKIETFNNGVIAAEYYASTPTPTSWNLVAAYGYSQTRAIVEQATEFSLALHTRFHNRHHAK